MKILELKQKILYGSFLLLLCGITGCNNVTDDPARKLITKKPATINWENTSEEMISYSADVTVYRMNNRFDSALKKDSTYRLCTKLIDGDKYTRLDMLDASPDGQYRSIITGPQETIIFNTLTNEIQQRTVSQHEAMDFAFLQSELGFGKVNLDLIKKEAKRLALDVTNDQKKSTLLISLPNEYFSTEFEKRISTKLSYDTKTETLTRIETIDVIENESTVTSTMEYVYQEIDGNYVKIGMITTIDTKYDNLIELNEPFTDYYESYDDIPEISDEDFEKMQSEGNIFEIPSFSLGNPADLSSVVTTVEVYDDIDINNTDDSVFKLIF